MKRLVYSPKVYAYVKSSRDGDKVYDLSSFIVRGNVKRKVNAVSSASLTLRNPNMMFTTPDEKTGRSMFAPMDPITIYLERLAGRPVRVFTGFLDRVPYYAMYPGTIDFTASCTLKKILYTYFDPGLPYVRDWLKQYGWEPMAEGTMLNFNGLDAPTVSPEAKASGGVDSSVTKTLHATLTEIGNWTHDEVIIEPLPIDDITQRMTALYDRFLADNLVVREQMNELFKKMIGEGTVGEGVVDSGDNTGGVPNGQWVKMGFTVDNYSGGKIGGKKTGNDYAELGVTTTDNAYLSKRGGLLADVFPDLPNDKYGLKYGQKLEIKNPSNNKVLTVQKCDNGSGQAGNAYYKIDIEEPAAKKLGWSLSDKGDVLVRAVS